MDERDINISTSEREALQMMENISDITAEQLHTLKDDEDCGQTCSDIAETVIAMQMKENPFAIDTRQALADFHQKQSNREQKKRKKYVLWTGIAGVAATVAVVLVARTMLLSPQPETGIKVFEADHTAQQVTLQVGNEETVKPLQEAIQSLSASSAVQVSPQTISYHRPTAQIESKNIGNRNVQIHRLSIPRGEVFKVVLPDGTEVLLNSDSRLTYPTAFSGKERNVSLEGEAFFSVAKDAEHPFIVKSGGMQVRVLGTEFNVRSYSLDDVRVTLIEGKVAVSDDLDTQSVEMKPGQSAQLTPGGTFRIEEIDPESLVYWKEGFFYFDNRSLTDMMKEIGRWYNVDIKFRNSKKMNLRMHFLAKRQDSLFDLIQLLNRMESIHASLEGGKLVIE